MSQEGKSPDGDDASLDNAVDVAPAVKSPGDEVSQERKSSYPKFGLTLS